MIRGTNYELLTQQVYQILLNAEWPGKNICVLHDVKLAGISGQEHQIDVYWEYELAGIKNRVAIECKDYSKPLAIGKVRDFYGVLEDLKDVKGIIIAANGFQKGAKDYAKAFGINLKELTLSDEVPVIAEIVNNTFISTKRRLFMIDEAWAKGIGLNVDSYRKYLSVTLMTGNVWLNARHLPLSTIDSDIVNSNGEKITSLEELESTINKQIISGQEFAFPFDDAYVNSSSGLIKIKEVLITDKADTQSKRYNLVAEGFVKAILRDAIDGNIQNILCPERQDNNY